MKKKIEDSMNTFFKLFPSFLLLFQIKFIVRQIHREEKTRTQSSIKTVNPNTEYWLGNAQKPESLRVEVLPRLFTLGTNNKMGAMD